MATRKTIGSAAIHAAISQIAEVIAARHSSPERLIVLGIANGGLPLSRRVAARLTALAPNLRTALGSLDISFHRDDIGANPIPKEHAPTIIPHDVNGATVILADDVLHSGRTVKAALDELFDHGRPTRVELAVLVDRGGRRLPVSADYVGLTVAATDHEKIVVHLDATHPAKDSIASQSKIENQKSKIPHRALAS